MSNTANYKFKQAELYTIARLVLSYVTTHIISFSGFKARYTPAWVTARLTEIETAEDLPDLQQRNQLHETLRITLGEQCTIATILFKQLERYITDSFIPEHRKSALEAAGKPYYTNAADEDLDDTAQLLNAMVNFVTANQSQLEQAGQNMPATFLPNLITYQTNFTQTHAQFLSAETGSEIQTTEKITANNNIYSVITSINADAQAIFHTPDNSTIREQFILEKQLYLVRGAGVAGMRFKITNTANLPIDAATITIPEASKTLTTNPDGVALQLQLAAQTYTVQVQATGYQTHQQTYTVQVGTVKRVNIQLTPNP